MTMPPHGLTDITIARNAVRRRSPQLDHRAGASHRARPAGVDIDVRTGLLSEASWPEDTSSTAEDSAARAWIWQTS